MVSALFFFLCLSISTFLAVTRRRPSCCCCLCLQSRLLRRDSPLPLSPFVIGGTHTHSHTQASPLSLFLSFSPPPSRHHHSLNRRASSSLLTSSRIIEGSLAPTTASDCIGPALPLSEPSFRNCFNRFNLVKKKGRLNPVHPFLIDRIQLLVLSLPSSLLNLACFFLRSDGFQVSALATFFSIGTLPYNFIGLQIRTRYAIHHPTC